jgi:hypothetical protein
VAAHGETAQSGVGAQQAEATCHDAAAAIGTGDEPRAQRLSLAADLRHDAGDAIGLEDELAHPRALDHARPGRSRGMRERRVERDAAGGEAGPLAPVVAREVGAVRGDEPHAADRLGL